MTTDFGSFLDGSIPLFQRIAGNKAVLLEDFRYRLANSAEIVVAKKGFIYDGGSIPRLLWGLSTNPWADDVIGPATIHDWLCQLGRLGESPFDSERVHYIFFEALRAIGVTSWRARLRWLSVKTAGPRFKALSNG